VQSSFLNFTLKLLTNDQLPSEYFYHTPQPISEGGERESTVCVSRDTRSIAWPLCDSRATLTLRGVYSDRTQLNSTQLNSTRQREQQLTQFVDHDVINKKTRLTWLYAVQLGQFSSVELCRYKHPFSVIKLAN